MSFRKWMMTLSVMIVLLLLCFALLLFLPLMNVPSEGGAGSSAHSGMSGDPGGSFLSGQLEGGSIGMPAIPQSPGGDSSSSKSEGVSTLRLIWGGDVLLHDNMLVAGLADQEDRADFSFLLKNLEKVFSQADLTVVDMEGTLGSPPFEAYPLFHAPRSVAKFLHQAGVDVAVTANNHCLDAWAEGLKDTKDALVKEQISCIGTAREPGDRTWENFTISNIRVGLTAFTYETVAIEGRPAINGLPVPEGFESCIDSFSYEDARFSKDCKRMQDRVHEMRESGAQLVTVFLHWGTEYDSNPTQWQRQIAQALADAGADLILACGPHVIQPIETIYSSDGTHRTLVYYSVGNLVSAQYFDTGNSQGRAEDGILAMVEVQAREGEAAEVVAAGYTPLYCYKPALRGGAGSTAVPIGLGLREPDQLLGSQDLLQASLDRIRQVLSKSHVEGIPFEERLDGSWMGSEAKNEH